MPGFIPFYYTTSSASGQDEPNLALWLATRAGKMELSCPLGIRVVPQGTFIMLWCFIPYNKSFIDQACSVKMAGYWPRSFFACLWTSTSSRSMNTQKKELGQYPAILTSRLVNNPYLLRSLTGHENLAVLVARGKISQLVYIITSSLRNKRSSIRFKYN